MWNWRWYSFWRCCGCVILSSSVLLTDVSGILYLSWDTVSCFSVTRISLFATTINNEVLEPTITMLTSFFLWETACVRDLAVFDRVLDAMGPEMFASENDFVGFDFIVKNVDCFLFRIVTLKWWIGGSKWLGNSKSYLYTIFNFYYLILFVSVCSILTNC